ncbi:MAG: preprotein translocase subunit SecE [Chloroflexi bacterium]|nr:preprotein translocase subunit SecE [Chloroflexota bacterium]
MKAPREISRRPIALPRQERLKLVNETVAELKKVVWPTRQEAINLTTVVIIISVAVGVILGLIDLIFTRIVNDILLKVF